MRLERPPKQKAGALCEELLSCRRPREELLTGRGAGCQPARRERWCGAFPRYSELGIAKKRRANPGSRCLTPRSRCHDYWLPLRAEGVLVCAPPRMVTDVRRFY